MHQTGRKQTESEPRPPDKPSGNATNDGQQQIHQSILNGCVCVCMYVCIGCSSTGPTDRGPAAGLRGCAGSRCGGTVVDSVAWPCPPTPYTSAVMGSSWSSSDPIVPSVCAHESTSSLSDSSVFTYGDE
mmetsp:Transcript_5513/g.11683  ORF Transcript_5513/g.11683 Transcript_5513/m.11683 type:complete len:129 (+) Transcript_5513:148-534(+)